MPWQASAPMYGGVKPQYTWFSTWAINSFIAKLLGSGGRMTDWLLSGMPDSSKPFRTSQTFPQVLLGRYEQVLKFHGASEKLKTVIDQNRHPATVDGVPGRQAGLRRLSKIIIPSTVESLKLSAHTTNKASQLLEEEIIPDRATKPLRGSRCQNMRFQEFSSSSFKQNKTK